MNISLFAFQIARGMEFLISRKVKNLNYTPLALLSPDCTFLFYCKARQEQGFPFCNCILPYFLLQI